MTCQKSFFTSAVMDYVMEQMESKFQSVRMISRCNDSCKFRIRNGDRRTTAILIVRSDVQISIFAGGWKNTFSLSHPNTINQTIGEVTRSLELFSEPFDDENINPDLLRQLLVIKAMAIVSGLQQEQKTQIHASVSQALTDLRLKPMRFPNSRRDQIRRAFLLLVGLESAPKSRKASWMREFQNASRELGTLRVNGMQIAFNPYLFYRKMIDSKELRAKATAECSSFRWFIEEEEFHWLIEAWTQRSKSELAMPEDDCN
jgi:hypothetical protein